MGQMEVLGEVKRMDLKTRVSATLCEWMHSGRGCLRASTRLERFSWWHVQIR